MTPVKALNEQKSVLPLYLCCVRCLSKARTKFQSDFHRRTNRFKRKTRRTKINVIKTKWMQKRGNEEEEERKKWSRGKRTITVAIHTLLTDANIFETKERRI